MLEFKVTVVLNAITIVVLVIVKDAITVIIIIMVVKDAIVVVVVIHSIRESISIRIDVIWKI